MCCLYKHINTLHDKYKNEVKLRIENLNSHFLSRMLQVSNKGFWQCAQPYKEYNLKSFTKPFVQHVIISLGKIK